MGFCSKVHSPGQMEQPPWIGTFNHQPRTLGIFTACHLDSWFSRLCDSPHPTTCPWSAPSRRGSVVQWFNSLKLSALSCGRRSVIKLSGRPMTWTAEPNVKNHPKTKVKKRSLTRILRPKKKTWVNEPPTYLSLYLSPVACWDQLWIQVTQKRQALQWHIATTKRSTFISLGRAKVSGWVLVGDPGIKPGSTWLQKQVWSQWPFWTLQYDYMITWKTWHTNFFSLANGLNSEVLKISRFCGPRHDRVAWCSEWWQWNQYALRSSPTPLSTLTCVASCTSQGCRPAGWSTYERPCPPVNLVDIMINVFIFEDLAGLQMNGRFPLISHTRYQSHTSLNCPSNSCPTPSSCGLKPFVLT